MRLIERQAAMHRLHDHNDRAPTHRFLIKGVSYGPCLLVSSEPGSCGADAARFAGEALGWKVFDRELVDEIAQQAHVRNQLIQSVDEQTRTKWEEFLRAVMQGEDVSSETYLNHLRRVLLALGNHGEVVIVGRGAQYVLPAECSLRVRFTAPTAWRRERIAEQFGLTDSEARARMRAQDESRAEFIRRTFRRDIRSPLNYDLTINTASMPMESAVKIVVAAVREKLKL